MSPKILFPASYGSLLAATECIVQKPSADHDEKQRPVPFEGKPGDKVIGQEQQADGDDSDSANQRPTLFGSLVYLDRLRRFRGWNGSRSAHRSVTGFFRHYNPKNNVTDKRHAGREDEQHDSDAHQHRIDVE